MIRYAANEPTRSGMAQNARALERSTATAIKPVIELSAALELGPEFFGKKDTLVLDLDRTVVKSKTAVDPEMAELLSELLRCKRVVIISGGSFEQFEKLLLPYLKDLNEQQLGNLYIFPTSGATFYRFIDGAWKQVYAENLSDEQKARIHSALHKAIVEVGYPEVKDEIIRELKDEVAKVEGEGRKVEAGPQIEDRGTQITFSPLGQYPDADFKNNHFAIPWAPIRERMLAILKDELNGFEVVGGGSTSMDIRNFGIDKEYGMRKIEEHLPCKPEQMLFVGNELSGNGNDAPVRKAGIDSIEVKEVENTKLLLRHILEIVGQK